eukprot:scpid103443/ scgid35120/ 
MVNYGRVTSEMAEDHMDVKYTSVSGLVHLLGASAVTQQLATTRSSKHQTNYLNCVRQSFQLFLLNGSGDLACNHLRTTSTTTTSKHRHVECQAACYVFSLPCCHMPWPQVTISLELLQPVLLTLKWPSAGPAMCACVYVSFCGTCSIPCPC